MLHSANGGASTSASNDGLIIEWGSHRDPLRLIRKRYWSEGLNPSFRGVIITVSDDAKRQMNGSRKLPAPTKWTSH